MHRRPRSRHGAAGETKMSTAPKKETLDLNTPTVEDIMCFEDGAMDEEETIVFFQKLIDSGMAWRLQGSYGRAAMSLIEQGLCHR